MSIWTQVKRAEERNAAKGIKVDKPKRTAKLPEKTVVTPQLIEDVTTEILHTAPPAASFTVEVPRQRGRPKSGRVVTTLRLDPDVIETLKSQGPGWQSRANGLLRAALKL